MRGYFGLREPRDPDAYLLALAVDGLPPVVFGLGATGWAPTVELTWYMRAVPAPRAAARWRRAAATWAAGGSTRRPRSGTRRTRWSRRAGSWPGSAAGTVRPLPDGAGRYGTLLIRQTRIEPSAAATAVPANSVG